MKTNNILNLWKAVKVGPSWTVQTSKGKIIATINKTANDKELARVIASAPYMLQALQSVVKIMGEEDLPDNGEFSGAAISDMVRAVVSFALG